MRNATCGLWLSKQCLLMHTNNCEVWFILLVNHVTLKSMGKQWKDYESKAVCTVNSFG